LVKRGQILEVYTRMDVWNNNFQAGFGKSWTRNQKHVPNRDEDELSV